MISERENIEKLFSDKFEGYKAEPSAGLWDKIYRKMVWKEFITFSLTSFNAWYLTGIIALSVAGLVWITNPKSALENQPVAEAVSEDQGEPGELITKDIPFESQTVENQKEHQVTVLEETPVKSAPSSHFTGQAGNREPRTENKELQTTNHEPRTTKEELQTTKYEPQAITPPSIADYSCSVLSGCGSLTVQFENRTLNANTYTWYFGDGGTSNEENPTYIYDRSGEYTVTLKATGEGGESMVTKNTIRVYDMPEAIFELKPEDAVLPDDPVTFYNYSQNAVRYLWDFGDNSSSAEAEPVHYYSKAGEYDIKLKVWSREGCTDSMVIFNAFADNGCNIVFPNAFTPNPNGPSNGYHSPGSIGNDVFFPKYQGVVEYRLRIYNRFGKLIFESRDLDIGWDGYVNGKLARQDVYIWKVRGRFQNGKSFVRFGNVTLLVKK
jgi:gliding motility-associated-like protein